MSRRIIVEEKKTCVACFEGAKDQHYSSECRAYAAQVAFNGRMARLLADRTPLFERPVPAPKPAYGDSRDMEPTDPGVRNIYALLRTDGLVGRRFRAAVSAAAPKGWKGANVTRDWRRPKPTSTCKRRGRRASARRSPPGRRPKPRARGR